MKITVAMRIIGGFTLISALLIGISISSFYNLNEVSTATSQVSNLTLPTLNGSHQLKAQFLNMGRLTFEAYIDETLDGVKTKQNAVNATRDQFLQQEQALSALVNDDTELRNTLNAVNAAFEAYQTNVDNVFSSHRNYLNLRNSIADKLGEAEEAADDAATQLLDFAESNEGSSSKKLKDAIKIGSKLETALLSLLTASSEYVKTQTLVRAQTLGNEVTLSADKVSELLEEMVSTAGNQDKSGTLSDIKELAEGALEAITGDGGVFSLQVERLQFRNAAELALKRADENSSEGIAALEKLLTLADKRADDVRDRVESTVATGTTVVVLVSLVSLGIAAGIGYFTVIAITRPLNSVNTLLNVVASGDLTQRLEDKAQDEFGELARNCNKLISNLKSLIQAINTRAEQLAAAAEQTSTVTTQTTHAIQDQKSQISQVAAATTEMHSASQLVMQNAEDTLSQIRHADSEAKHVREISLQNKGTIEVLARDVEQAAGVINKLHQDSASIGGILDVIRGIAEQTNLLALNAAIEAARAGEQGRGFAVVADEVRTLASRTQESTREINAMIEVLQAGAEKAVAVMNQGKEQTAVCVKQTEQATSALDLISQAVHKAYDVSSQIAQSAQEQNTVSQEISEKLETIVGIAEETSVGAQQTSQSSGDVARLAEELQQSIRKFKV